MLSDSSDVPVPVICILLLEFAPFAIQEALFWLENCKQKTAKDTELLVLNRALY